MAKTTRKDRAPKPAAVAPTPGAVGNAAGVGSATAGVHVQARGDTGPTLAQLLTRAAALAGQSDVQEKQPPVTAARTIEQEIAIKLFPPDGKPSRSVIKTSEALERMRAEYKARNIEPPLRDKLSRAIGRRK